MDLKCSSALMPDSGRNSRSVQFGCYACVPKLLGSGATGAETHSAHFASKRALRRRGRGNRHAGIYRIRCLAGRPDPRGDREDQGDHGNDGKGEQIAASSGWLAFDGRRFHGENESACKPARFPKD